MSNSNPENDKKDSTIKSNVREARENLMLPQNISTVHADRAMVAVDNSTQTATITLFTMHAIPKISEQFDIENYAYELAGEIKMPFTTLDALAVYYLTTRTNDGNGLLNMIQKHLREHPLTADDIDVIRYGPTTFG